jgi:dTDP-4-amino-4,6-dideoxygalactose transaminase
MVLTDDAALEARLRRLRNHGAERSGWRATFVEPGFNYRLSDINAALGLVQVPRFADVVARRRELAASLSARIAGIDGVAPQRAPAAFRHPYQAFVITCDARLDRDALVSSLRGQGVESTLGTYAMHAEPSFQRFCGTRPGELPVSRMLAAQTLALPLHERMADTDVDLVAEALDVAINAQ